MDRRGAGVGWLVVVVGLLLVPQPARAVITALFPLKGVLANEQFIFLARVDQLDPERPGMVLKVDEDLKGKPPFRRLAVNLRGDAEADKEKQRQQLLKRLEGNLPLVVFTSQRGKRYTAFAYTNGTWFQMIGQEDAQDPAVVRWAFTHCEPYLRRTFKGTTAELRQVVRDGLAGKRPPPEPDPKEPPGLGPEVKPKPSPEKEKMGRRPVGGPLLAVIPTFVLVGPVALLAALFPAVFGGLAGLLRRWLAFISIASLNSTLALLHLWFRNAIQDYWWGSSFALWTGLALLTLVGAVWAGWRHRRAAQSGKEPGGLPPRSEQVVLWLMTLSCLGLALYCMLSGGTAALFASPWREMLIVSIGVWVATLYTVYLRLATRTGGIAIAALPIEVIMLWAMVFGSSSLLAADWPRRGRSFAVGVVESGSADTQAAANNWTITQTGIPWVFQAKDLGRVVSTPLIDGDRVYVAAAHQAGFQAFGAIYCFDRATGSQVHWQFDDGGAMKPVFSSPCLADGRLFVGEGFHQDKNCKFYCLDAKTGAKIWEFPTASHTESSPTVADGKVYFGAGDDGLYCLDARTGKPVWHFPGLHVDTPPTVVGKRLYAGSGYGRFEAFCLDTDTGRPIWEVPLDLPSFAAPTVSDEYVFYGIGNGDFLQSDGKPAGALLCLRADHGAEVWRSTVPDAVHGRPAVDSQWRVYFGTRDGNLYCLARKDGALYWKTSLGSPIVASPELARCPCCGTSTGVYVAATDGLIACLDPDSGRIQWSLSVRGQRNDDVLLVSSPKLIADGGEKRRIYFGAGLGKPDSSRAAVYCVQDELVAR
jgi:outer membrane protein assembly factor BamB